jgi:oligopeptide transport system substrate-binding protein
MKWYLLILSACLPLLFGCFRKKEEQKQVLRLNFLSDPSTLDPRKGGDPASSTVQFMLFEGLTRMTERSSSEPALAEKITLSEDGTLYTFHLRDSFWSDGHRVTAYDFEIAWKNMLSPSFPCPNAHLLYPIKHAKEAKDGVISLDEVGVQALDAKTLQVTLEAKTPYFLELIAFCVFSPVPSHITQDHPDWADKLGPHLVTNGPFSLKTWKPQNEMIFERNPSYWEASSVALEGIRITFIDNETTALQLFEKNELDFLGLLTPLPLDSIPKLKREKLLKTSPIGATTYCSFNLSCLPFSNPHIRKAFSYAIDRKALVKHTTQLDEEVATNLIPSLLKFNQQEDFFPDANPELAMNHLRQGLEELKLTPNDLSQLTLTYFEGDASKKIVQAIQQQWKQTLGIQVNLECYTFKVYLDKLYRRDYDFAYTFLVIQYNDLMNILDRYKFKENPKNYPGWENPEYIRLLDASSSISNNQERISFLRQAEELLLEDMPVAPIYHWNHVYISQEALKGVYISPIGSIHFGNAYLQHIKESKHEN